MKASLLSKLESLAERQEELHALLADPEVIAPILERISLESLGYPEAYCQYAKELGWQELEVDLMPQHLAAHYSAVLKTLESREKELTQWVSLDYLERMKNGLRLWIEGGNQKSLTWGAFKFLKPA